MHLADWKNAGKYFDCDARPVFYRDQGVGDALVCIHGFPTASWDWHRVWPELTKRFRVIACDMLGFGFSAKPRRHMYSLHEQATLHERLLRALGVNKIHILAHDYGDTVAQELLARDLEHKKSGTAALEIGSVCLLNGGLFLEATRPLLIQKLLVSPLGPLIARLNSEWRFRRSFSSIFGPDTRPTRDELRDFWALVSFNDGFKISHRIIQYMKERKTYRARWTGALQQTRVPLRFINGTLDPISGATVVARYRELLLRPDVVELNHIGHYPQIEDPGAVTEAFFAFLNGLRN